VAHERRRTSLNRRRTAAVLAYNREFEKGKDSEPAKVQAYADVISATEGRAEAFRTARPGEGLDAMKAANEALDKSVSTPKPAPLASLVDAIEAYASTAKRVGDAAMSLKL